MTERNRITIPVDDDLDKRIRQRAEDRKMSISDVVRQALLDYLNGDK